MANSSLKALAANRLSDGIAVWAVKVGDSFHWTENWSSASALNAADAAELEAWGIQQAQQDQIVSERLIDVVSEGASLMPSRLRERIVAAGPTVRPDLGKQAEHIQHARAA
ncbi:MAG: DUF2849 domain-containing protein [Pseudomonadota bacterium]